MTMDAGARPPQVIREVEKEVIKTEIVEVPVEREVIVEVIREVEKEVIREVKVEVPVEVIKVGPCPSRHQTGACLA